MIFKKDILILDIGPTQELDDATLTTDTEYSINLTEQRKQFCLRLHLHYNGSNHGSNAVM